MSDPKWRTGRTVGNTIYKAGKFAGSMISPEAAKELVLDALRFNECLDEIERLRQADKANHEASLNNIGGLLKRISELEGQLASGVALFQSGNFHLHSGQESFYKIDCDALTDMDWDTLAKMIAERVQFSSVTGVPTGGNRLAEAMSKHLSGSGPHLVVDDVLTTGESILGEMKTYAAAEGFVVFARGPLPNGVQALFVAGDVIATNTRSVREEDIRLTCDRCEIGHPFMESAPNLHQMSATMHNSYCPATPLRRRLEGLGC